MKILIVSVFFPPYNTIASYRAYSWAKWWSKQGHHVTVITPPKKLRPQNTPMSFEGFHVIELPAPGLAFIWRFWSGNDGLNHHYRTENSSFIKKTLSGLRHLINKFRERYGCFYASRMPDYWDIWAWSATRWATKQSWDAVVTTGGPYSVHWVGLNLKKKQLTPVWAMDWRDLWTHNHIFPGLPLIRNIERYLENRFHSTADIITTVSEPLASTLRELTDTSVHTILNGYDPDDLNALDPTPIFPSDNIRRIVYTGSIYAGKQDPLPLFLAIKGLDQRGILSSDQLQIIFAGSNCDLSESALSLGVEDYCHYMGFVSRPDALRMQRDADILLFMEFESPEVKGILTGKLFEYIAAAPPIWAIGSEAGAGKIIKDHDKGQVFGKNIEKIQDALLSLLNSPFQKKSDAKKTKIANEFSRETQAYNYLELLEQIKKNNSHNNNF
ncbi:MAG: hypothetical protein Kow0065_03980 [Methylomicrobium sp.]